MKFYYLIFLLFVILLSCSNEGIKKLNVYIEADTLELQTSNNSFIGLINDFVVDKQGKIYLLDGSNKKIFLFSKEGKQLKEYGKGEGKGPGEFLDPRSIDIDKKGNLYICDLLKREITVLDSNNNVLATPKVKIMPAKILVIAPFEILMIGFPFTYKGNLIHKYRINTSNSTLELENSFCERVGGDLGRRIDFSGNTGRLLKDQNNFTYYSFSFPYEIRKYNQDGKLLKTFKRNLKSFTEPFNNTTKRIVEMPAAITDIFFIKAQLAVRYRITKNNDIRYLIDIFDVETGEYTGTINTVTADIRIMKNGQDESIIYGDNAKFPQLISLKFIIEYKK
jgi:hypothetical protein